MELKEIKIENDGNSSYPNIISKYVTPLNVVPAEILTIKICLGTPKQCFNVVYDTGSYYLWLSSKNSIGCESCKNYDEYSSTTFEKSANLITIKYVTGMSSGFEATDYINLDDGSFIFKMSWMLATFVNFKVEGADGIIGFGREYSPTSENSQATNRHSFINSLYEGKIIKKKVFSQVFVDEDLKKAKLYIGEYAEGFSQDHKTFCNVYKSDSLFDNHNFKGVWTCRLSYLLIGDTNVTNFYKEAHSVNSKAILDSGSNFIFAPFDLIEEIKKVFSKFPECKNETDLNSGISVFYCSENFDTSFFPNFSFIFNGYGYTVPGKRLFKKIDANGEKILFFTFYFDRGFNYWLLGQYFLRNFHVLFDHEKDVVGFTADNQYITDFTKYTTDNDFYLSDHLFLMISIFLMVVLVATITIICFTKKRNTEIINQANTIQPISGIENDQNYYQKF
jgi:cathepsin D